MNSKNIEKLSNLGREAKLVKEQQKDKLHRNQSKSKL